MPPADRLQPCLQFACPVTKAPLREENGMLTDGKRVYRRDAEHGFWRFISEEKGLFPEDVWNTWLQLQANGEQGYINDPVNNLGIGPRKDFLDFAAFCSFRGDVLDVGVGPQRAPTHMAYNRVPGVRFTGVDPLAGDQPRDFSFVLALAEYLPFPAAAFDQVLFVTSLDHFLDPTGSLREAARVLKPDGEICVWLGEKDPDAPKPATSPEWYRKLKVPPLAEDLFHFKRLSYDELLSFAKAASLAVKESACHEVDKWRRNYFVKLIPFRQAA